MAAVRERYHHGDLRNALVRTATRLVERNGADGLSLRDVAARIGVSPSAVYRHFSDKNALLVAVALDAFAALTAAYTASAQAETTEAARPAAAARGYVAFALEHPALYRLILGAHHPTDPALREAGQRTLDGFHALIARRFGLDPHGAEVTRRTLAGWSLIHGYVMLQLDGPLAHLGSPLPEVDELFSALSGQPGA